MPNSGVGSLNCATTCFLNGSQGGSSFGTPIALMPDGSVVFGSLSSECPMHPHHAWDTPTHSQFSVKPAGNGHGPRPYVEPAPAYERTVRSCVGLKHPPAVQTVGGCPFCCRSRQQAVSTLPWPICPLFYRQHCHPSRHRHRIQKTRLQLRVYSPNVIFLLIVPTITCCFKGIDDQPATVRSDP